MSRTLPLLLLLLAASACAPGDAGDDRPAEGVAGGRVDEAATKVVVEPLTVGPVRDEVVVSGRVSARTSVPVFPKLGQREITSVLVEEGDVVERGEPLMALYDEDLVLDVRQASAAVDEAESTLAQNELRLAEEEQRVVRARREADKRRQDHERLVGLQAEGLVMGQDLEDKRLLAEQAEDDLELARLAVERAEVERTLAEIALRKAEIALDRAEKDLSHTRIVAPLSGVVAERHCHVGQIATTSGAEPPFLLVDTEDLVLDLRAPQDALPELRAGQAVEARAVAADLPTFAGRVRTVIPVLDAETGSVQVLVDMEEAPGLVPGLFIEAKIVTDERDGALLVDKRAVLYEDEQPVIFAINGGDAVEKIPFRAGASTATEMEVLGHTQGGRLDAGLLVVVVGQENLKDGDAVTVVEEAF